MSLLDQCTDLLGPVGADTTARLRRVFDAPSQATWEDAHSILITPNKTLWQAWADVDPAAPDEKPVGEPWPRIPDSFTLYRAIKHANRNQGAGS